MGQYAGVVGGIGTMMSVRERPWHWSENQDRVRIVEHNVTSGAQALTLAGIGWGVEKIALSDMTIGYPNAEEFCVVVRDDTRAVLGVHKSGYGIIPNQAVGDMADAIILAAPDGAFIDTAGSLFEPGRVVWMLVRLPDMPKNLDSEYEPWLLIATSHDGSKAFSVRFVRVRVVCMNTFAMAIGKGSKLVYTVRHTSGAEGYLAQAREAVGMAVATSKEMDEEIERLLDTTVTVDRLLDPATGIVAEVNGVRPGEEGTDQKAWDRAFEGIVQAYTAQHNQPIQGTAWGAVNAFQEYEQWGIRTRKPLAQVQMGKLLEGQWPMTRKALALLAP